MMTLSPSAASPSVSNVDAVQPPCSSSPAPSNHFRHAVAAMRGLPLDNFFTRKSMLVQDESSFAQHSIVALRDRLLEHFQSVAISKQRANPAGARGIQENGAPSALETPAAVVAAFAGECHRRGLDERLIHEHSLFMIGALQRTMAMCAELHHVEANRRVEWYDAHVGAAIESSTGCKPSATNTTSTVNSSLGMLPCAKATLVVAADTTVVSSSASPAPRGTPSRRVPAAIQCNLGTDQARSHLMGSARRTSQRGEPRAMPPTKQKVVQRPESAVVTSHRGNCSRRVELRPTGSKGRSVRVATAHQQSTMASAQSAAAAGTLRKPLRAAPKNNAREAALPSAPCPRSCVASSCDAEVISSLPQGASTVNGSVHRVPRRDVNLAQALAPAEEEDGSEMGTTNKVTGQGNAPPPRTLTVRMTKNAMAMAARRRIMNGVGKQPAAAAPDERCDQKPELPHRHASGSADGLVARHSASSTARVSVARPVLHPPLSAQPVPSRSRVKRVPDSPGSAKSVVWNSMPLFSEAQGQAQNANPLHSGDLTCHSPLCVPDSREQSLHSAIHPLEQGGDSQRCRDVNASDDEVHPADSAFTASSSARCSSEAQKSREGSQQEMNTSSLPPQVSSQWHSSQAEGADDDSSVAHLSRPPTSRSLFSSPTASPRDPQQQFEAAVVPPPSTAGDQASVMVPHRGASMLPAAVGVSRFSRSSQPQARPSQGPLPPPPLSSPPSPQPEEQKLTRREIVATATTSLAEVLASFSPSANSMRNGSDARDGSESQQGWASGERRVLVEGRAASAWTESLPAVSTATASTERALSHPPTYHASLSEIVVGGEITSGQCGARLGSTSPAELDLIIEEEDELGAAELRPTLRGRMHTLSPPSNLSVSPVSPPRSRSTFRPQQADTQLTHDTPQRAPQPSPVAAQVNTDGNRSEEIQASVRMAYPGALNGSYSPHVGRGRLMSPDQYEYRRQEVALRSAGLVDPVVRLPARFSPPRQSSAAAAAYLSDASLGMTPARPESWNGTHLANPLQPKPRDAHVSPGAARFLSNAERSLEATATFLMHSDRPSRQTSRSSSGALQLWSKPERRLLL